jgi:hypothetical protein
MIAMTLTPGQASESLKDIEATERRSAQVFSYAKSSPYFILWGVVWMAGYGASGIMSADGPTHFAGPMWAALDVAGIAGSMVVGYRQNRGQPATSEGRRMGARYFGSLAVVVLFFIAAMSVIGPIAPIRQAAFFPLVIAMFYAIMGLWRGSRFLFAGVGVTLLTLFGFFVLKDFALFCYWMAAVGGGALVLAGLWLRKV